MSNVTLHPTGETEAPLTESEVRALRDAVYGQPATDKCWEACGHRWMQPEDVAWLKAQNPHQNL